tara:strand:- start:1018 stop:1422 length:405 start_codon:yes stop_codon:yes gene_type:complete
MGYLFIKNINYDNIAISYYKKQVFNIRYITDFVTLYGINLKVDYINYEIINNILYLEIIKDDYDIIYNLNEKIKEKINKYKSFCFSKDNKYYIKLYYTKDIHHLNNKDKRIYLWISKIKNKNYINYPIIYIINV